MTNEQEIERMVNAYENARILARGTVGSMNRGEADWYCRCLQNAGIGDKKQAVKEAFDELQKFCADCDIVGANGNIMPLDEIIDGILTELYGAEE